MLVNIWIEMFIKRLKNIGNSTDLKSQYQEQMEQQHSEDRPLPEPVAQNDSVLVNIKSNDNQAISAGTATSNPLHLPPVPPISPLSSMFVIKNYFLMAIWCWLKQFRAIGIVFALTSVLFWSFNGLSYKLNHHIHALEILTISSFIVSLTYLGFMFTFYGVRHRSKTNNWNVQVERFEWSLLFGIPGERTSLIMRCLCGTISLACFYSSYRYIPLGDATTIRFTSPVFIAIFAHFMVNEPFGLLQIINSLTTLIGVILIGRPSFIFGAKNSPLNEPLALAPDDFQLDYNNTLALWQKKSVIERAVSGKKSSSDFVSDPMNNIISIFTSNPLDDNNGIVMMANGGQNDQFTMINDWSSTLFGVFLSLIAAISISISMIFMRKLRKTPPPLVIFWFSLSNVILGAIGLWVIGEYRFPVGLECWLLIVMTTICTGLDQFFITLALKLENAGAVAVIQALCVVLSFIFSISILHEPLYWTSALGGTFIFFSVLVLGCSKLVDELNYSDIKSTIFAINILHSNSKKFKLDDQTYSKLSTGVRLSANRTTNVKSQFLSSDVSIRRDSTTFRRHSAVHIGALQFGEPYLLRVAPIIGDHSHLCGICIQNLDLNNNDNEQQQQQQQQQQQTPPLSSQFKLYQ